jgi:aryl-alcohol dehydrogenase-like predicted oxidoreductase
MNRFMQPARDRVLLERVQELVALAGGLGITPAQLALAWVLREPNVAAAIVGATRPEQVEDNAAASGIALDEETLRRIDEILGDKVLYEGPAS